MIKQINCGKKHGNYVPPKGALGPDSMFFGFSSVPRFSVIGVWTHEIGDMHGIYKRSENGDFEAGVFIFRFFRVQVIRGC